MCGWQASGSGLGTAGSGAPAIGTGRRIRTSIGTIGDSPALALPNKRIQRPYNPLFFAECEEEEYDYRVYEGRRYAYEEHWRSWNEWDRYRKQPPDIRKHGTYYRESGHLMFRFCDQDMGNCIFFSIGR
jgi:hypothetical protein